MPDRATDISALALRLAAVMETAPDFPKPGVKFLNLLGTLSRHPQLFTEIVGSFAERYAKVPLSAVAGIEARGFVFAPPLALALGVPFIPLRKPGKLPPPVHSVSYQLEYGEDTLEVARDVLSRGSSVLVLDDVLATGGTARAGIQLLEQQGYIVPEFACVVEIAGLGGRHALSPFKVFSLAHL